MIDGFPKRLKSAGICYGHRGKYPFSGMCARGSTLAA
jgi:hypothetical protein